MGLFVSAHALLAAILIASRWLSSESRVIVVRASAGVGSILGVALFLTRHVDGSWRTISFIPQAAALAGLAIACAWLVVAVTGANADGWRTGALVGVASSSLALFGLGRWTVPSLLFWMCGSVAIGVLTYGEPRRGAALIPVALSDVALVAASICFVARTEVWSMPSSMSGWSFWLVLAAVVLRAGAIPSMGTWALLGSGAAPALPLLTGGSFVLLGRVGTRVEPWLAAALVILALALAVVAVARRRFPMAVVTAWPVMLGLSLCFVDQRLVILGGSLATIAMTAAVLWPLTGGHGRAERGLLLAFVPATLGFAAVAFAAVRAFEQSRSSETVAEAAPWTIIAALLPLTLAAGVTVGARAGRQQVRPEASIEAILGTWLLLGVTIILGFSPSALLEGAPSPLGAKGSVILLNLGAVAMGAGAGWLVARRQLSVVRTGVGVVAGAVDEEVVTGVPLLGEGAERWMQWTAVVVALAAVAGAGWLTIDGLRKGFL